MTSKTEKLFNDFISLKQNIQNVASIVQNEGMEISVHELNEWSKDVNKIISTLYDLKIEVVEFYNKGE